MSRPRPTVPLIRTASPALPGGLTWIDPAAIVTASVSRSTPRNPYRTGYGWRIPTSMRVMLVDGRERRVYGACYGNAVSLWLTVGGKVVHVGADAEARIAELLHEEPRR